MADKHHRFNNDFKNRPYGRLDWVGYLLALKHTMSNQFARSQGRQQIADCRLGGRPPCVALDVDDGLLGPTGDPGEGHRERPVCVIDSLLHRNGPFYAGFPPRPVRRRTLIADGLNFTSAQWS